MRIPLGCVVAFIVALMIQAVSTSTSTTLRTSLAAAPSVKLHVTLKRKSMAIHGQTDFDVLAEPVVTHGKKILYNGYATFIEDGQELIYVLVNGAFYLLKSPATNNDEKPNVQCLSSTLPFDAILPALNDMTPIPSASIGGEAVDCSSGDLFQTTVSESNFALCASGTSGFTAFSSDMTIEVTYVDTPIGLSESQLRNKSASCSAKAKPTPLTPTALALLTGGVIPSGTSRNLKASEHLAMEASSCECKSTPRPCIVFHGSGVTKGKKKLQDEPVSRMGSINDHAPCCSTVKYAHINMMAYAWNDGTLQQKFCDYSLSLSESSDEALGIIDDTIIVTDSMGGTVMAGALATGKCSFGKGTSWVAISSPMKGTMVSDYGQDFCNDEHGAVTAEIAGLIGQCPLSQSRQSFLYEGEKYSSTELNTAYVAAQEAYSGNVTAAMCSNDYDGVMSVYHALFVLSGMYLPHKSSENDGLVEFQSCAKGLDASQFGTSYTDRFYKPRLNHADTAFLTTDGWFSDAKKPFKWLECLL